VKQQFSRNHTLRLPQLLHPDLIHIISGYLERGAWLPNHKEGIGRELLLASASAIFVLRFLINTPEFLKTVERITQCGPVSVFDGRVYRMVSGTDHYNSWHSDVYDNRLVGMSLNLGPRPYRGGVFQLRKKGSDQILCELPNVVQGDAILFRISPELRHRMTPMEGTEPKTAFAGWFKSGTSDFFSDLRNAATHAVIQDSRYGSGAGMRDGFALMQQKR
jgi:hypothetical protein